MNPYNILGIPQSANYDTARKKYIQLAKKYHPDNFVFRNKITEEKMKKINNAFNLIKQITNGQIIHSYHKGKLTQAEINQVIIRFNKGYSLNKISRELNRSREAIRRHLIRLGYLNEPVRRAKPVIVRKWYDIFMPSFHSFVFIFMIISMILSFPYMALICLALIILISD